MSTILDPTEVLIVVRPPFQQDPIIEDIYQTIPSGYAYRSHGKKEGDVNNMVYTNVQIDHTPRLTSIHSGKISLPPIQNVDVNLYNIVEKYIKNLFGKIVDMYKIRVKANPFENIGLSHFMNRAAIKIAACDAIFKFTGQNDGVYIPQIQNDMFRYSCVAEGPGAFVQYIQYRLPQSIGFGITLNNNGQPKSNTPEGGYSEKLNWKTESIDMKKFTPIYGDSNTGDITKEWKVYSDTVMKFTGGVDLCTGDGGLDVSDDFELQEFISAKLIYYEVLIGLLTTKYPLQGYDGGTLFLKIFNTVHKITQDLIYILTCCFENVWIHKPISSRPLSSERYLIATKKRSYEECEYWINFLIKSQELYIRGEEITSLLSDLPPAFNSWITNLNNMSMKNIYKYSLYLLKYAGMDRELNALTKGNPLPEFPKYDLNKALILWNLPSNSLIEKSSCPTRGGSRGRSGRDRGRSRGMNASIS